MVFLDCRKSGFAAFSRKLRCVLRLCCPLIADNSTLTPRKVFSSTHMSRQKTYNTAFASADAKLCEAFFDKLENTTGKCSPVVFWRFIGVVSQPQNFAIAASISAAQAAAMTSSPGWRGKSGARTLPMSGAPRRRRISLIMAYIFPCPEHIL